MKKGIIMSELSLLELDAQFSELLPEREALGVVTGFHANYNPCQPHHHHHHHHCEPPKQTAPCDPPKVHCPPHQPAPCPPPVHDQPPCDPWHLDHGHHHGHHPGGGDNHGGDNHGGDNHGGDNHGGGRDNHGIIV
jgi:hypothetical protein